MRYAKFTPICIYIIDIIGCDGALGGHFTNLCVFLLNSIICYYSEYKHGINNKSNTMYFYYFLLLPIISLNSITPRLRQWLHSDKETIHGGLKSV